MDAKRFVARWFFILAALTLLSDSAGCRPWVKPADVRPPAAATRLPGDTVVLEIAVAEVDQQGKKQLDSIWGQFDQQAVGLEDRRPLDQNGIRAAVIGGQVPAGLHELIEPQHDPPHDDAQYALQRQLEQRNLLPRANNLKQHQRIQNFKGQTHWVGVADAVPQLNWLLELDSRRQVGTCLNATSGFAITTFPRAAGIVQLTVAPEIHHGQTRSRYAVANNDFVYEDRQQQQRFDELAMEVELRPGETLILAAGPDPGTLGRAIFRGGAGEDVRERFLLVRLVHTQQDDWFAPRQGDSALVSPLR